MIKVITKVPCPYCERAMNLLRSKDLEFTKIDLTNRLEELEKLRNETGWKTVPMIYINEKMIGGYNELKVLDESGDLDRMGHHTNGKVDQGDEK